MSEKQFATMATAATTPGPLLNTIDNLTIEHANSQGHGKADPRDCDSVQLGSTLSDDFKPIRVFDQASVDKSESPRETVSKIVDHVKSNYSTFQKKIEENKHDEWQQKVLKYRFQI
jgi:hypothetical protein